MLTRVDIQNVQSEVLSLPLGDTSGGYAVHSIDGLDPVKATLVSSTMAQIDGAQPQSSSRGTRNLVFKIGFQPNYQTNDVTGLRTNLYNFLMPKSLIHLTFYMDGDVFAVTDGIVESFDSTMFSAEPEITISIICYDPDFIAPEPVVISGNTVSDSTVQTVTYNGTSDVGVVFTLNLNRDISGFTLQNTHPDNTLQIFEVDGALSNGDVITATSIPRSKSLIRTSSGLPSSILFYLTPAAATWITLTKGDNQFRAFADGAPIPFTLVYTTKYGAL